MDTLNTVTSSQRKRLLSMAYGYLGSLTEAEDVVQDAMLRLQQASATRIENEDAWLNTVVTRISIDRLRSARYRSETYPGEWLPEPVWNSPDPEQQAITRSRLSVALLYLLEGLEPNQRAVFVLREVFEEPYSVIAEVVGKSEAACRQLMVRAQAALNRAKTSIAPRSVAEPVVNSFIQALQSGDAGKMLESLAPDAVLVNDGGGKVPSVLRPIYGAERIVRFYIGVSRKLEGVEVEIRPATINAQPGFLTYRNGELVGVCSVAVCEGTINGIYAVSNPDKIRAKVDLQRTVGFSDRLEQGNANQL